MEQFVIGENIGDEFDIEILADKTVEMLSVSPGQVIWIWASTYSLDFIEALAYRIRMRGAYWTVRLISERLLHRIGQNVPEEFLPLTPEHELRWLADINAIVEVRDHSGHIPDVALSRRRAMGTEWLVLIHEASRRGCRRIVVSNPTPALASAYGIPLAFLRQLYWRAINIDYHLLDKQQERVGAMLSKAKQVHVTSALGTDLSLRIDQRPVHLDTDGIPRGEVYIAPHEDSANGIVVIDKAFIRGQPIEHLRLTFVNGRVATVEAPDPKATDLVLELLLASSGDKDVIAEFAIGINPGETEPTGDIMLDEKIGGSVHIAIGMNELFGGRNKSNLHLDLVILCPKVWLDETLVVDDGELRTNTSQANPSPQ
jgi:leucyl aminopeptidase (aminopeptidase T)